MTIDKYPLQTLYQKAMRFAGEKHHDQLVPGSTANYLLHISNVAMEVLVAYYENKGFNIELALPIAILHDTLEDTDATFEELSEHFGHQIATGVQALTKNNELASKSAKMKDSLERILSAPKEVAIVKLADRITNLQTPPAHWSQEKVHNYLAEAKVIAETLKGRNDYLDGRIELKIEEYVSHLSTNG